jgi:excisionase family DNA binding protein
MLHALPESQQVAPELLTAQQTAELLGVSQRLVWLLAANGDLPAVRIRRCTRWRRADVLAFVDQLAASQTRSEAGRQTDLVNSTRSRPPSRSAAGRRVGGRPARRMRAAEEVQHAAE